MWLHLVPIARLILMGARADVGGGCRTYCCCFTCLSCSPSLRIEWLEISFVWHQTDVVIVFLLLLTWQNLQYKLDMESLIALMDSENDAVFPSDGIIGWVSSWFVYKAVCLY